MSDLVAFLVARLNEDERVARDVEAEDCQRWTAAVHVGDHVNTSVVTDVPEASLLRLDRGVPALGNGDSTIALCGQDYSGGEARAAHIARHDPARVLAEVAAKRRIVTDHTPADPPGSHMCPTCVSWETWRAQGPGEGLPLDDTPCATLRLLAMPYADHPKYRLEWCP